ncbi:MAG: hypothetical protein EBY22_05650 [Gammaproteobacteria bacterium]|nr:hypothetical protein [Gammaproteobacteria bacterium]
MTDFFVMYGAQRKLPIVGGYPFSSSFSGVKLEVRLVLQNKVGLYKTERPTPPQNLQKNKKLRKNRDLNYEVLD